LALWYGLPFVLEQAFEKHPNRFKGKNPKPSALPQAA
jgi:hypothetical protein